MGYVLIEVVGREISQPEYFKTLVAARAAMASRVRGCDGHDPHLGFDTAWCETANHDDADWKIFKIPDAVPDTPPRRYRVKPSQTRQAAR